jgi:hypothetical protein
MVEFKVSRLFLDLYSNCPWHAPRYSWYAGPDARNHPSMRDSLFAVVTRNKGRDCYLVYIEVKGQVFKKITNFILFYWGFFFTKAAELSIFCKLLSRNSDFTLSIV